MEERGVDFDKSEALSRCDEDAELLRELIKICIEDGAERMKQIQEAGLEGNADKLDCAAHSMKSAMGNVGGMACYQTLLKLELLGRSGSTQGFDELYKELRIRYEEFQQAVKSFCEES